MARYIDADKLIAHLKEEIKGCEPPFGGRANGKSIAYGTMLGLRSAISFAETLATTDVAPKSEVAREIFEELETVLCYSAYPRVNANRTITVVKSKDFHIRCDDYDALKKKCTEEKE